MIYVHLGFPKTATTSLQLFASAKSSLIAIGKPDYCGDPYLVDSIVSCYKTPNNPRPNYAREFINNLPVGDYFFSEENFCLNHSDIELKAQLVNEIFPDSTLVFSIRKPVDLVFSYFGMELKKKRLPKEALRSINHFLDYSYKRYCLNEQSVLGVVRFIDHIESFRRYNSQHPVEILVYEKLFGDGLVLPSWMRDSKLVGFKEEEKNQMQTLRKRLTRAELVLDSLASCFSPTLKEYIPTPIKNSIRLAFRFGSPIDFCLAGEWEAFLENLAREQYNPLIPKSKAQPESN